MRVWNFTKTNFFACVFKLLYQHCSGKFCILLSNFSRSRSSHLKAFFKKVFFKNFRIQGKILAPESSFKVAGCFKKRLWHRSFFVSFANFLTIARYCRTSTKLWCWNVKFQATSSERNRSPFLDIKNKKTQHFLTFTHTPNFYKMTRTKNIFVTALFQKKSKQWEWKTWNFKGYWKKSM